MTREEYNTYLVQTFEAFCRKVIRNTAISLHRERAKQLEREKSLSDLSNAEMASLSVTDTYNTYTKEYDVLGETVKVHDPDMGEALQYIQPQLRSIILMRYFLDMSNNEIAEKLKISKATASYRVDAALKQLRQQIRSMNNIES